METADLINNKRKHKSANPFHLRPFWFHFYTRHYLPVLLVKNGTPKIVISERLEQLRGCNIPTLFLLAIKFYELQKVTKIKDMISGIRLKKRNNHSHNNLSFSTELIKGE